MAHEITFTAERVSVKETIIILFNCQVSSEIEDAEAVKSAISAALKQWAKQSAEAKTTLNYTEGGFNFADLATVNIDNGTDLLVFLRKEGIFDIKTQTISGETAFSRDTILMGGDNLDA